jgi:predicted dienelactone hydrolase
MNRFITVLFIIISLVCAAAAAQEAPSHPTFNVGYRILDFKYQKDGRQEVLTVAVWYPTAEQPKSYTYGRSLKGTAAVNGAPLVEGGPFPLLVFSHGYGGSGLSAVFFTERLAAYGWIVAAPDHHDKYPAVRIRSGQLEDFNRQGFLREVAEIGATGPNDRGKYLYRLDEMKLAIDGMVTSEPFGKIIDTRRIAVGGHSFGGFTALGLCGTIKERLDTRIKAILLFSTGAGGYLFREDELSGVRMPSMLYLGERERDQLRGTETMSAIANKIYSHLPPPKYFLEVKGANHFSFNNGFTDDFRARFLSGTSEQFDVIRRYSIAFLEKHVAGRIGSAPVLESGDAMLTRYLREPLADTLKK